MSSILHGAGTNALKAFKDLYNLWFYDQGNKTQYLKTLEEKGVNLANMSSILSRAGANAPKAFKELYDFWFDAIGNKRQHLKHFIKQKDGERSFTLYNISGILSKSGAKVNDADCIIFVLITKEKGQNYDAGFMPSNLFSALCGIGVNATYVLERFHGF